MHVNICTRNADGTTLDVVESVGYESACVRIDTLTGRPGIGAYVLAQAAAKRRRGRAATCYVAVARNSPWRSKTGRGGFIIEVVR